MLHVNSLESETTQKNHGYIGQQLLRIERHLYCVLIDSAVCLEFLATRNTYDFFWRHNWIEILMGEIVE